MFLCTLVSFFFFARARRGFPDGMKKGFGFYRSASISRSSPLLFRRFIRDPLATPSFGRRWTNRDPPPPFHRFGFFPLSGRRETLMLSSPLASAGWHRRFAALFLHERPFPPLRSLFSAQRVADVFLATVSLLSGPSAEATSNFFPRCRPQIRRSRSNRLPPFSRVPAVMWSLFLNFWRFDTGRFPPPFQ